MSTELTHKTVADLTVAELRALIRETVAEAIAELIEDPDEGLELSDWTIARLEAAQQAAAAGERQTIPLAEIASL
jgi:hypothetical protein